MANKPGGADLERGLEQAEAGLLLAWYEGVKRPLPWRSGNDPYLVWLSEVMLQQTRVEAVIPYYERFLEAFPSVAELARASEEDVRALWSGLGYYHRARALLAAAREVVAAGRFPRTALGWRRLPGVGPYTAAAVASIVYGESVVALDGNIERVLTRLEAYDGSPKTSAGRRFLTDAAERWLDADRPGDSNQALMELGATVCRPKSPLCSKCPIPVFCTARRQNRIDDYPRRAGASRKEERRLLAVCVRRGDRLLLFRRDSSARLLAGSWELPWVDGSDTNPRAALASRYGGVWELGKSVGSIRHAITRWKLIVTVSEGEIEADEVVAEKSEARWVSLAELDDLPHSSLVRKAFLAAAN